MEYVHDKIEKYQDDVLSALVKKNLSIISKSLCSKLDEALDELEKLIKSKFDTSLILFPDTVSVYLIVMIIEGVFDSYFKSINAY